MISYEQLPLETRVWIYQSNRPLVEEESARAKVALEDFARQWVSHNNQLHAYCDVWHQRFIVMMVDETRAGASGCSIDKSVHFLQALGAQLSVDLFDRMVFTYRDEEGIHSVTRDEFAKLYNSGKIDDQTIVFDTLVSNKAELERSLEKPLHQSWHARFV